MGAVDDNDSRITRRSRHAGGSAELALVTAMLATLLSALPLLKPVALDTLLAAQSFQHPWLLIAALLALLIARRTAPARDDDATGRSQA